MNEKNEIRIIAEQIRADNEKARADMKQTIIDSNRWMFGVVVVVGGVVLGIAKLLINQV